MNWKTCILVCFSYLSILTVNAQLTTDYAVQASVKASLNPTPRVTISWTPDSNVTQYTINRKTISQTFWGGAVATLPGTATQFIDSTIGLGQAFEYRIWKQKSGGINGYGYVYAGIEYPVVENRGKVILVIDSLLLTNLALELNKYAGKYQHPHYGESEIIVKDNALFLKLLHHKGLEGKLEFIKDHLFYCRFNDPVYGDNPLLFTVRSNKVKGFAITVRPKFIDPVEYLFEKK